MGNLTRFRRTEDKVIFDVIPPILWAGGALAAVAPLHLPGHRSKLRYTYDVYGALMKPIRKSAAERTNIVLDSRLVERVKLLAKVKTTRDAVHAALEHYVRSRDYSGILALRGTGGVAEGYDPKAARPPR